MSSSSSAEPLAGRVALVVGGTTGIGLATALALAGSGARVMVAGRSPERGAAALRSLEREGFVDAEFQACDVTDEASVQALVQAVLARWGRLDCAVNSAAQDTRPAPAGELSSPEAQATLDTDVLGLFHCLKHQIAAMRDRPQGQGSSARTIVNVASVNGLSGTPGAALYSAGKHAVIGLTRSLALEAIGDGIRINAVCPGATDTPRRERRSAALTPVQRKTQHEQLCDAIPIGRLARAEEIAQAILWLSSPASSYVVGHSLVVDGGLGA